MDADIVTPPPGEAPGWKSGIPLSPAPMGRKSFNLGSVIPRRLCFDDADADTTTTPPPRKHVTPSSPPSSPAPMARKLLSNASVVPRRLVFDDALPLPPKPQLLFQPVPKVRVVAPPPRNWTSGFEVIAVKWNQKAMDAFFSTSGVKYMR